MSRKLRESTSSLGDIVEFLNFKCDINSSKKGIVNMRRTVLFKMRHFSLSQLSPCIKAYLQRAQISHIVVVCVLYVVRSFILILHGLMYCRVHVFVVVVFLSHVFPSEFCSRWKKFFIWETTSESHTLTALDTYSLLRVTVCKISHDIVWFIK